LEVARPSASLWDALPDFWIRPISCPDISTVNNEYLIVLVMSLSYIPVRRIGYSLFTVLMSGQLIGLIQKSGSASHSDAEGLATSKCEIMD
jgi:hypothetical protein